jgi:vacuolar protein sorting-associated protein 26
MNTQLITHSAEITENKSFSFEFKNADMSHDTYSGNNARLRYFLRVKLARQYSSNITKTLDFAVQNVTAEPDINNSIKMEVGIEVRLI